ncbi:MAG: CCA tRNA nucleotidyltransferase [Pseudomonadota bacterium]
MAFVRSTDSLRLDPRLTWIARARPLLRRLAAHAGTHPDPVRFIGGCVRNALIDQPVQDVDIATILPPQEVLAVGEAMGIKTHPIGLAHGTVTVVLDGTNYEVTTLRRDIATDGRHAQVAFTDDWQEDARRRDFTFNALSANDRGAVFDPFDGIADLRAGIVRFIGDPKQRIEEDYLRMLRFFRFLALFGQVPPDPKVLTIIRRAASNLARLAPERVAYELLRLLAAPDPVPALIAAQETGLDVLGFAGDHASLARLIALPHEPDPLLRLGALLPVREAESHDPGMMAETLASRLRLSRRQTGRLRTLAFYKTMTWQAQEIQGLLLNEGRTAAIDAAAMAGARGGPRDLLTLAQDAPAPPFPLSGDDLTDLGLLPGPIIGQVLDQVREWWTQEGGSPDHAACLNHARALIGDEPDL